MFTFPTTYFSTSSGIDLSDTECIFSLRKMNPSYNGFCIKLRRDSDNATQDIGFVSDEVDSLAITTFLGGSTGYCDTYYDQSGNNNNATQTVLSKQPRYSFSFSNGKAGLVFTNGNQSHLVLATAKVLSEMTVVAAIRYFVGASNTQILATSSGSGSQFRMKGGTTTVELISGVSAVSSTGIGSNVSAVVHAEKNSTTQKVGHNNVSGSSVASTTLFTAGLIGSLIGSNGFNGFISELYIYNKDKSTTSSREDLVINIMDYFAI